MKSQCPKFRQLTVLAAIVALSLTLACSRAPSDAQLAQGAQNKINNDPNLSGKPITVGVSKGVATISGQVENDFQRTVAANDALQIDGVKSVVNDLDVAPIIPTQVQDQARPEPEPAPVRRTRRTPAPRPHPAPSGMSVSEPVVASVTIPAGTTITIRMIDSVDSKQNKPGDAFRASLEGPITVSGAVVVPKNADVNGQVVASKSAGHFAGSSDLVVGLTRLSFNGASYTMQTDQYTKQGASRGKRTAEVVGGGAAIGALIGGLTGGGKGAAIGAGVGAGAGTGVQAATHGQQVQIPSETVLQFRLAAPLTVKPSSAQRNAGRAQIG